MVHHPIHPSAVYARLLELRPQLLHIPGHPSSWVLLPDSSEIIIFQNVEFALWVSGIVGLVFGFPVLFCVGWIVFLGAKFGTDRYFRKHR